MGFISKSFFIFKLMHTNDSLWKGILEDVFDDFLRFFFKDADKLFDMGKGFKFLDKELEELFSEEEKIQSPMLVDKLIQVFTRNESEEFILVHVEVQGYSDKVFAERMFNYYYRILYKYNKKITAISIFTDSNKNYHPQKYEHEFLGTEITYKFNTYKIIDQDEVELLQNNNPFAIIVLTVLLSLKAKARKLNDEDLLNLKFKITRNLLSRNIETEKVRGLMNFLRFYVRFANSGMNAKFDEEIYTITEKRKTMGIEEMLLDQAQKKGLEKGIAKGKAETNAEIVKKLIIKMGLSDAQIADILGVPITFVQKRRSELKNK
jgi:predicted transposase/invertase (TIGR01784 family)